MFRCVTLKAGLQKRLRLPAPARDEKEALSWLSRPFDGVTGGGCNPVSPATVPHQKKNPRSAQGVLTPPVIAVDPAPRTEEVRTLLDAKTVGKG